MEIIYRFKILDSETNFPLKESVVNIFSPPVPLIKIGQPDESGEVMIKKLDSEFLGYINTGNIPYGFRIQSNGYKDVNIFALDEAENPIVNNYIDLGNIYLTKSKLDTNKANTLLQKANAGEIERNSPSSIKIKGEGKLVQILTKNTIDLKSQLVPPILDLISSFGISQLDQILSNPNIYQDPNQLSQLLKTIPKQCPSNINEIIQKRNLLVKQLNTAYTSITIVSTSLTGLNTLIEIFQTVIPIFSALPIPNQFTTVGLVITLKEAQDKLKDFLSTLSTVTSSAALVLAIMANVLKLLITLLQMLDLLIKDCSEEQNIPFSEVNSEISSLTSNQAIINMQSQQVTYRGFILEVILEPTTEDITYPKRRAVAKNTTGVIILKGEASFSSDIQVLIDELKFIIDSQPNLRPE
jgi:hypothetical protein